MRIYNPEMTYLELRLCSVFTRAADRLEENIKRNETLHIFDRDLPVPTSAVYAACMDLGDDNYTGLAEEAFKHFEKEVGSPLTNWHKGPLHKLALVVDIFRELANRLSVGRFGWLNELMQEREARATPNPNREESSAEASS